MTLQCMHSSFQPIIRIDLQLAQCKIFSATTLYSMKTAAGAKQEQALAFICKKVDDGAAANGVGTTRYAQFLKPHFII